MYSYRFNGLSTLSKVVMPTLFPPCAKLYEVGCYFLDGEVISRLLEVSPDGVIK